MGLHAADAIVLRRYPYRETSVTLSCFTDRYGKLKGLVKGLRTQPNRYGSALEPLTVNRIVFYDTRASQLHLISQCDLLAPFPELQRDVETARAAALCAELVDAVTELEDPHPAVYALLKHTLERLALGAGERSPVQIHFIVRLLRLAGFQPQVDQCTACNSRVQGAGFWSARQGGLLCPACRPEDPRAEPAGADALEQLAALAAATHPIALDPSLGAWLASRLREFLHWRLDRPLKTLAALA